MDLGSPACVRQYLVRIKFPGFEGDAAAGEPPLPPPTVETLRALHHGHTVNIAFENLSVPHPKLKAPVTTDIGQLWSKLVLQRRGGWCAATLASERGAAPAGGAPGAECRMRCDVQRAVGGRPASTWG